MSLISNIIALIVLILTPLGVWVLYGRRKREILAKAVTTSNEGSGRNIELRNAKEKYKSLFAKITLPALLVANILTIGDAVMDKKDEKLSQLETSVNSLQQDYGRRIKDIEDYLFPPDGPSRPAVFKRIDELEKSRDELEALMLRVTDPNPELERKVRELENQIQLLKAELEKIRHLVKPAQRGASGAM